MTGILFFFEDNDIDIHSGRAKDMHAWHEAMVACGDIDRAIVVNRSNYNIKAMSIDCIVLDCFDAAYLDGHITQVVSSNNASDGAISLWDYKHDTDWYLFGDATGWLSPLGTQITIPRADSGAYHAVHAASIVLAHRYSVLWR